MQKREKKVSTIIHTQIGYIFMAKTKMRTGEVTRGDN